MVIVDYLYSKGLMGRFLLKNDRMLLTGFRLLAILKLLYEKDLQKKEIIDCLKKEFNISVSDETLKLDLNTLKKAGYKIKRGHKGNNYKLKLDKNFIMLKFTDSQSAFFSLLKDFALENLEYSEIYALNSFYNRLKNYFNENDFSKINNFGFFDVVNEKLIITINHFIQSQETCDIIYSSPQKGVVKLVTRLKKLDIKNNKLYVRCSNNYEDGEMLLRADNIKQVSKSEEKYRELKTDTKKTRYKISKEYFKTHPLENIEKIVGSDKNTLEIELLETNNFFNAQRIISLGTNCISVNNDIIKERIIKNLDLALELYK